jgi:hypothetical protein
MAMKGGKKEATFTYTGTIARQIITTKSNWIIWLQFYYGFLTEI